MMVVDPHKYVAGDPEKMTPRARAYLAITAIQNGLLAYCCIAIPGTFRSSSFMPIISVAPLWVWGLMFCGSSAFSIAAAIAQRATLARIAMSWSAVAMGLVATGLVIAMINGMLTAPTGPIVWTALAAKDFVVCAQPMRSPFEALAQRLGSSDRRRQR